MLGRTALSARERKLEKRLIRTEIVDLQLEVEEEILGAGVEGEAEVEGEGIWEDRRTIEGHKSQGRGKTLTKDPGQITTGEIREQEKWPGAGDRALGFARGAAYSWERTYQSTLSMLLSTLQTLEAKNQCSFFA